MAKDLSYFLCVLSFCVSLSLVYPLSCYAADDNYLFVFGDSLFDPGNNMIFNPNIPSSRCPFGMTFFHRPTGRFSDGRLVPDHIATKLNLPFMPPIMDEEADFTHGVNFASAGSGVFDHHPNAINLPKQYINYTNVAKKWAAELGDAEANRRLRKAVYLISAGGNDYFSYGTNNRNASFIQFQGFVESVITDLTKVIKDIYKIGARKFMFQNVQPLGCLPMIQQRFDITDGCARPPLTLAVLHNNALFKMAESIKNSPDYSEFTYSIFDAFTLLGERIRVPEEHGFKVGDAACYDRGAQPGSSGLKEVNCRDSTGQQFDGIVCSNPEEYVFFDDGHNTDELNRQLADILWSGGHEAVYPYNLKQLIAIDPTLNTCSKRKSLCAV